MLKHLKRLFCLFWCSQDVQGSAAAPDTVRYDPFTTVVMFISYLSKVVILVKKCLLSIYLICCDLTNTLSLLCVSGFISSRPKYPIDGDITRCYTSGYFYKTWPWRFSKGSVF